MSPVPTFLVGDCREVLKQFPDNHFHACVTDPPYGLSSDGRALTWDQIEEGQKRGGFMGHSWDAAVPGVSLWKEVLRVLKPGASAMVFGGTRTFYRLGCALEDAGFEMRDSCLFGWVYGSGFPKSMDIAKAVDRKLGIEREVVGSRFVDIGMQGGNMHADREHNVVEVPMTIATSPEAKRWEGWGTALKPSWEPIILCRKPASEPTLVDNILKHGTGGLNVGACRIPTGETLTGGNGVLWSHQRDGTEPAKPVPNVGGGRWPANFLLCHTEACILKGVKTVPTRGHWGGGKDPGKDIYESGLGRDAGPDVKVLSEEVEDWSCYSSCPVRLLDEQSGELPTGAVNPYRMNNSSSIYGGGKGIQFKEGIRNYAKDADSGGASRFFYCAKAGSEERAFWCTVCEAAFMLDMESGHTHGKPDRAHLTYHPTVKPQEIAEWLIRLVTPKGGIVLDPFVGSGTTLVAAKRLGFESVGVDQDPTYIKLARRRCGLDVVGPMDRFADGAH